MRVETYAATGRDEDAVASATTERVESETDESRDTTEDAKKADSPALRRRIKWSQVLALGVVPILALLLAVLAGFLKWHDSWVRTSELAGAESVAAAKDSTVALLSYRPDTAEKDLEAARDRLTGKFKDSYTRLINDVVIPGAKRDHIAAVATVPAASSVSATPRHAVVMLFVDQTVTVGADAPTETASTVRVSLDKAGDRWLISAFDPV